MNGDRNLLLGVLAQQMDFIGGETLIAGLRGWMRQQAKPLGDLLRERGHLTLAQLQALNLMVEQHILAHQGDALSSLAALPATPKLQEMLRSLREPELEPVLASLGATCAHDEVEVSSPPPSADGRPLRYHVLRPHARGGLGEVYVALDDELNREVALKAMQPQHADVALSRHRFVLEAEITGGLEHPGIVPVYGLGAYPDGRPYYAMRFIRGENLKEAVARYHKNSTAENAENRREDRAGSSSLRSSASSAVNSSSLRPLLRRFIDMCNAVAYAHSRGVIHRDLKPANVMLGQFGETLVVDWGLAKTLASKTSSPARSASEAVTPTDLLRPASGSNLYPTQMGSALGTPPYMSPEQAAGKLDQLGHATDIYSLGATLFTILTNRPPVEGNDVGEYLRKVQAGDAGFRAGGVSPLSTPANSLRGLTPPAQLRAITQKAMSLNPADRYASALDFARDLENYLADEPVSAYPEPLRLRLRRFARRHRTLVTSAAAVLVVATIGSLVGLFLLSAKNTQLATAFTAEQAARTLAQEKEQLALDRKKQADANFVLALDAVKAQVFDIDQQLQGRAGTRDLREKLQKSATERLKQLVEKAGSTAAAEHTAFRARVNLGDVYFEVDLKPSLAKEQYLQAEQIARQRAAADPSDAQAQRDLALSFNNLGDVTLRAGQPAEALKFYNQGLDIRKKLAAADPSDAQGQRDLSRSFASLGDVTLRAGQPAEALKFYNQVLDINKKLAAAVPRNGQAQRDLALSFLRLGDVTLQAGQPAEALKFYNQVLDINMKLAAADPSKAEAQRDLSASLLRLGDVTLQAGQPAEALKFYNQVLDINMKLAAADPSDAQVQRDLSLSFLRLGLVTLQAGQPAEALKFYSQFLDISKKLAAADPSDAEAQRDLSLSFLRLGDVTLQAGEPARALEFYRQGLDLSKKRAGADPSDARAQTDLFVSYWKLGSVEQLVHHHPQAIVWFNRALDVVRPLHAAGKLHGRFKDAVADSEKHLATCELLAKLSPGLIEDPAWPLLWGWPRF